MDDLDLVITMARSTHVEKLNVRRALPQRSRRTVGAWCFIDHIGPASLSPTNVFDVAPHPHIGLHTVTWLFEGALVHRDGLGSEQLICPGQLNVMAAGHGVAHSEENAGATSGQLHGVQLWVAQPTSTREGAPTFEHHAAMPMVDLAHGAGTVLVGTFADTRSPVRVQDDLVGVELRLVRGVNVLPLEPTFEYGVIVVSGAVELGGEHVTPGYFVYVHRGRDELRLITSAPAVVMMFGGTPLDETVLMWWNFVARTHEEISSAYESWLTRDERFLPVASSLPRLEGVPPPWTRSPRWSRGLRTKRGG